MRFATNWLSGTLFGVNGDTGSFCRLLASPGLRFYNLKLNAAGIGPVRTFPGLYKEHL